jgi:hypothetical protein
LNTVHARGDPNSAFVAKELAEIEETVNFERMHTDVTYVEKGDYDKKLAVVGRT